MDPALLNAIAEPNRFRIVELLREQPCSVNDIVTSLGLNQPQVSKHLRHLAESGIVTVRPLAQQRIYALNPEPFNRFEHWVHSFHQHWDKKLDSLEIYLKKG